MNSRPAKDASSGDEPSVKGARWSFLRRRSVLIGLAVALVVGVSVLTDLPGKQSLASQAAGARTFLGEVNTDLTPCAFATKEAFTLFADESSPSLSASDRGRIPSLLRDDESACSFTDEAIYDLSNLDIPGGASGAALGQVVSDSLLWSTSDALAAIDDISALGERPNSSAAKRDLKARLSELAQDRTEANKALASASQVVREPLPSLVLPALSLPA